MDWKELLPDVIPYVSSPEERFKRPPDNLVLHYLRNAARTFLLESTLLRGKFCPDLQCGVREVPLWLPEGRELLRVHKVLPQEIAYSCGCQAVAHRGGDAYEYDDGVLTLDWEPLEDMRRGVCITYSYLIDVSDCEVPAELTSQRWRAAIVDFALAELLGMPNMDWHDKAASGFHLQKARHAAAKAKMHASSQGGRKRVKLSTAMERLF